MQGAIRDIESLKTWFFANGKPFFTLTYQNQSAHVIMRNTVNENMETAWDTLRSAVISQAEYGRATLHVLVYDREKANNPAARTNIDVMPQQMGIMPGMPGIGYLPAPTTKDEVTAAIAAAKKEWEMERRIKDLEEERDAPSDGIDKWIERIGALAESPVGMALIAKFTGQSILPAVKGSPVTDNAAQINDDEDLDSELDRLEAIATKHGLSLKQLLDKTAMLAENQPGMVSMLVQQ